MADYAGSSAAIPGGFLAGQEIDDLERRPLNFQKLLEAGAVRVTNQGMSGAEYNPDPKAGFSLVSGWNDSLSKDGTAKWPDNPGAYPIVMDMFHNRPEDIGAHKYRQIIFSAMSAGLKPEDIYLQQKRRVPGLLGE